MSADLEKRLAAIRDQREKLAAEEAQKAASAALLAEVEREERALADDRAFAAAVAEHGVRRVARVHTDAGDVIVKAPHQATYRRFVDSGKTSSDELERLVRPCVVHPSAAAYDEIAKELPAVPTLAANAVLRLAGFRTEDVAGKP